MVTIYWAIGNFPTGFYCALDFTVYTRRGKKKILLVAS